jgi:putative membrane protein
MKNLVWLVLPALALSACQKATDQTASSSSASDASSVTPQDGMPTMSASSNASEEANATPGKDPGTYLAKAGAGDLFEIESSRAILKTTEDPQVKTFAQMMIKDHEASTTLLKKTAKAADIAVAAPQLQPAQQQSLDAIKAAKGKDADKIYLDAQRDGHAAALMLHKTYAADGNNEELKAAAAQIVPVVQQHITMLDKIGK